MALTFAPLFLYWAGKGTLLPGKEWIVVPACCALIFGVGFFYVQLGGAVIEELRKKRT